MLLSPLLFQILSPYSWGFIDQRFNKLQIASIVPNYFMAEFTGFGQVMVHSVMYMYNKHELYFGSADEIERQQQHSLTPAVLILWIFLRWSSFLLLSW